jgi:hypothetical protein
MKLKVKKRGDFFSRKNPPQNVDKGPAISRILSFSRDRHHKREAVIPLGDTLLCRSSELTRKLRAGRTQTLPYLFLLRTEFGCFHSDRCLTRQSSLIFVFRLLSDLPFPIKKASDILSVPLFLTLRWGVVNPCAALWSPDFPQRSTSTPGHRPRALPQRYSRMSQFRAMRSPTRPPAVYHSLRLTQCV